MADFGDRIRERLKEVGLKQTELAKALDVSRRTINKWIVGEVEPGLIKAHIMCHHLNCNLHWLITGNGQKERVSYRYFNGTNLTVNERREVYQNQYISEIIEKLSKFDDSKLKVILKMVNSMTEEEK